MALLGAALAGAAIPSVGRAAFVDVTATDTGPALVGVTYGLGWRDFDLDGDPDAFVCRHYLRPVVFRNGGDGTIAYPFFPQLFDSPDDHHGGLIADFDQDGDPDIYLTGGADAGASTVPKKMYRNDGNFQFRDVAPAWGLADSLARGRASSAMDVDADGDVDLFIAKASRVASPNSLFLNDGNQNFTDVAAAAGVADDFGCVGGIWADYDRDGDPDLLIGGEEEFTFETRLYRNDGSLTFTNVTSTALPGIGQIAAAAFGDYDNDGDLDLAAGLGDRGLFDGMLWSADSLYFFFNTQHGDNGLDGIAFTQTGDSATYNLALDGFFQPDSIWISEAAFHPQFSPFTLPFEIFNAPPFDPGVSTGFYLWTSPSLQTWQMRCSAPPEGQTSFAGVIRTNGTITAASLVGSEPFTQGPRGTRLWRNDGGVFTDVTIAAGITDTTNVHQLVWVDLDQDGRLDLYALNKGDTANLNLPDVFYRNLGGGVFVDATAAMNLAGPSLGLGDACAFEDYDLDQDLDLMLTCGTGPRFIAGMDRLRVYRNDGPTGNALRVRLQGVYSTRDGYGAWVTCVSGVAGRQVRYVTGNNWRGQQEMLDSWFGLGPDAVADTVRVEWPSGAINVLTDVSAGEISVVENHPLTEAPVVTPALGFSIRGFPNPGTEEIRFRVRARAERPADVAIYDPAGRRVRTGTLAPGEDEFPWDLRDGNGLRVGSGVYFARVREDGRTASTRVVVR